MMTRNTGESDFTFRLGGYLMTAGGLGLAAGAANAAVTHINVTQTVTANNGVQQYDIDINGDTSVDLQVMVYDNGVGNPGYISIQGQDNTVVHIAQRQTCSAGEYYAGNVAPGTTIDSTLFGTPTPQAWGFIWSPNRINDCNNFVTGQWGTLAFREGTPGNYIYGYLNVRPGLGSTILEIDGGAYESTPNTPIAVPDPTAGEPRPVPVGPSVPLGISLLVAGAAAMRLRAKRKPH